MSYAAQVGYTVWTLTLISDGESDVRVFATEKARDEALVVEALERREASYKTGTLEDEWTVARTVAEPAEFINDDSLGDTDVSLDAVTVEG